MLLVTKHVRAVKYSCRRSALETIIQWFSEQQKEQINFSESTLKKRTISPLKNDNKDNLRPIRKLGEKVEFTHQH